MARNQAVIHQPFRPARSTSQKRGGGLRRWQVFAIVLLAIVALAWFDGGEEPIRPITQNVTLPEAG
ncbi:hypothetical protein IM511_02760 [Erythrobacteraceae bacterium E2-1 Yellow Sea]|nr:hypothetical protein [Erythrobacteraceae bacterium E2-1 Yellow Sea]